MEKELKKPKIIKIMLIILVTALLVTTISVYFIFFKKDKINVFDYVNISVDGSSGNGEVAFHTIKGDEKIRELIRTLDYQVLKAEDGKIANGDEIEIFIDKNANKELLDSNKITLAEERYTFTVSGLFTIPDDIFSLLNEQTLISTLENDLDYEVKEQEKNYLSSTIRSFGFEIPTTVEAKQLSTWYAVDSSSKSCLKQSNFSCTSVAYLYKLHAEVDNNRYILERPDTYIMIAYTGINYDENLNLHFNRYHSYDATFLANLYNLEGFEEKLRELGFEKV